MRSRSRWGASVAAILSLAAGACGFGAGEPQGLVELPDNPTWEDGISALMAVYCNDCHGEHPADGSLAYFRTDVYGDAGDAAGAYSLRGRLLERVEDHSRLMPPPPAAPMSPAEVAGLRRWVEQGAPAGGAGGGGAVLPGCQPAAVGACACPGGTVGEQICRLDKTWAPCACGGTGPGPEGPLDGVWRGVFQPSCVAVGCHAAGGAYPDLETRAGLRDRLLQSSVQAPGMALVEPGFLDGSYLYAKVREDFTTLGIGSGNRMPTGPLLPAAQHGALRSWIEGGALE